MIIIMLCIIHLLFTQLFWQEGVPEIQARILRLPSATEESCFIGNEVPVPVTEIMCVTHAPHTVFHRTSDSTLQPLTQLVCIVSIDKLNLIVSL